MVKEGVKRYAPKQNCLVDVQGKQIVVYHAERGNMYQKMLRFTLDDKKDRTFRVQRWCFKGSIDDSDRSLDVGRCRETTGSGPDVLPHLGRDSFYDLM